MDAAMRKGHPSEWSLMSFVLLLNLNGRLVVFGAIIVFAIIEVYIFYILQFFFLTHIVDVYSGLDNCEIQCSSQFPELRSSGSCPLYLVRLYLDGSLRFCVFGAFHRYGWKLDHWHCFSLSVVCLILFSVTESSHSSLICCFSLFVTWVFWLAAAAALTQSLGGALDCHTQTEFVYCGHLNALSGFAWLIWFVFFFFSLYHCLTSKLTIVYRVVLTFVFLFVIIRAIMGARRGEGVAGPMVEVWAKGKRSRRGPK